MLDERPVWRDGPAVRTIQDCVRDHAAHDWAAIAILAAGYSPLTYAELVIEFDLAGQALGRAGIGRSDRVAMVVPSGAEAAVATLTIAAHAACAPLNPDYTAREFEYLLSRLQASALLVPEDFSSPAIAAANALGIRVLYLRADTGSPARIVLPLAHGVVAGDDRPPSAAPGSALLLFTSGTTAHPKLVPLTHRQLCSSAENIGAALHLAADDRCLGVMPLFHIHGLSTLFATLMSGGSYVATSGFSADRFLADLEEFRPTWFSASPSIHRAIVEARSHNAGPAGLRFIRSASAPMPRGLVAEVERSFGVPLLEAYGMTEASPQIATNRAPPFERKPGSVGKPAGPEVAIMGEAGTLLDAGETGEVVIRGPNVIECYEGESDADDEAFVGGWFRTGDVGWIDGEGYLFITGRLKDIINRGGEKIAPTWVEEALREHPAVADVTVFGIPHPVLGEAVAAAVVLAPGASLGQPSREIRAFAATRLARFEVPQKVVIVDRIPQTSTGKSRRGGLAEAFGLVAGTEFPAATIDRTAPRTAAQQRVAAVFADVLRIDPPGLYADFFEVGGDSLSAMRVLSRLQAIFGVPFPIDALFASPTVAGVATRIGEELANLAAGSGVSPERAAALSRPASRGDGGLGRREGGAHTAPLTQAQQRVYFLDQMGSGAAYNMSAPLWLTGRVDERALALALHEIVRRHEILRSCFPMRGDRPAQVVLPLPADPRLEVIDLSTHPESARAGEARRLAVEEASRRFDLDGGPVFRAKLVRISDTESALLLTMHHIVSDAWSIGILYAELAQLYAAFRSGLALALAELPLQFADFALAEDEGVRQGRLDEDAAYWTRQLSGVPPISTFSTDRPRLAVQSYRGEILETFLDGRLIDRLRALGVDHGATLFMTLLAAFKALMFRYDGQEVSVVGVPIANRPEKELEGLIGFFANTLAMRTSLAGDPSFLELLARVRDTALGAFAHQNTSFERIVDDLGLARDPSRTPLFQVMFAFQNVGAPSGFSPVTGLSSGRAFDLAPDLAARPFRVDNGTAKFDLTLYLAPVEDGVALTWQFNSDLFDAATIGRIAGQFRTLLTGIEADPERRLSEIPLQTAAENGQIDGNGNRTDSHVLSDRSVVEQFEVQVERAPHSLAVTGNGERLTYRELNARANQFARYLQRAGVGPDAVVGVCLPRTPSTLVAMIAIWKAGGAFLPLDPDYPSEQAAFKLRDAGVRLLITQANIAPAFQLSATHRNGTLQILCIDENVAEVSGESTKNLERALSPDSLAYVMYTSGSTGQPKGVMITHRNVGHYVQAFTQAVGILPDDRYLHTASFSFSSSVRQFAVPLCCGAAVVVATTDEIRDPERLFETVREQAVSVVDLVPSFSASCLQILTALPPGLRARLLDNTVRLMLSASEPLSWKLVEAWRRLWRPSLPFINMYGQTETTGIVLTYRLPDKADTAAIVAIGRPIAHTEACVLDGSGRIVPVGICGELHLGGAGIGRGYVNRQREEMPLVSTGSGKRLYRTGDLARYRADGVIEFVGRADRQIKIRGYRIEPGEIEAAIGTYPGIRACAVTATGDAEEDGTADRTMVAFVVADAPPAGASLLASRLRAFLGERLPQHMVPARFIQLPELPRAPSGKVDFQALLNAQMENAPSAPVETSQVSGVVPLRANHDAAEILAGIWKKVLHIDSVGPDDNFFDLGGNSRLSIKVLFEARRSGLAIALPQIYQHQTLAELARVANGTGSVASAEPEVAAQSADEETPVLLSIDSLRAFGREALARAGLVNEGAEIVTEVQLEASMRGQSTHDMVSIPRYARSIAAGRLNPLPRIRIERETSTTAQIDGDNGPGQWVSTVAMNVAIEKARGEGVGIVSVRRSNHFGAAGHYVWEAARGGLIGLCTTNGPAVLAPTGGVTPTFGNNPLAIGIPAGRHYPILLDIAMSAAPRSKIGLAVAEGRPLPPGWILDGAGQPSTDLADLAAGLGVPIGGHKGYGLALAMEVLSGVLTGSGFGADHRADTLRAPSEGPDYGHLFMAIDPLRFMPLSEFAARVDRLIEQTTSGQRASGVGEILIPGQRELRARERSLKEGVSLRASTYRALVAYGRESGLSTQLAPAGSVAS